MKKFLSIIAFTAITSAFFFSCKPASVASEKTVSKTINMAVFTSNDYNAAIYNASTAGLKVTITKAKGNKTETVWEKSFPSIALKFFPGAVNAFKEAIQIPALLEKDILQVSYTLTYNTGGSIIQMQGDEFVDGKQNNGLLEINI